MNFFIIKKLKYTNWVFALLFFICCYRIDGMVAHLTASAPPSAPPPNPSAQSQAIARSDGPSMTTTNVLTQGQGRTNNQITLSEHLHQNESRTYYSPGQAYIEASLHAIGQQYMPSQTLTSALLDVRQAQLVLGYDTNAAAIKGFLSDGFNISGPLDFDLRVGATLFTMEKEGQPDMSRNILTILDLDSDQIPKGTYERYFTKDGLPKSEKYNRKVFEGAQISSSISTQRHLQDRVMLYRLAKHATEQSQDTFYAKSGIHFIGQATKDTSASNVYSTLARAVHYSLTQATASKTLIECKNFTKTFSDQKQQALQERALSYVATVADRLHSNPPEWQHRSHFETVLQTLDNYINKMAEGDMYAQSLLMELFPIVQSSTEIAAQAAQSDVVLVTSTGSHSQKSPVFYSIKADYAAVQQEQARDAFSNFISYDKAIKHLQQSNISLDFINIMAYDRAPFAQGTHAIFKKSVDLSSLSTIPAIKQLSSIVSQTSATAYSAQLMGQREKAQLLLKASQALLNYAETQENHALVQINGPVATDHAVESTQKAAQQLSNGVKSLKQFAEHQNLSDIQGLGGDGFDRTLSQSVGQQVSAALTNQSNGLQQIDRCIDTLQEHSLDRAIGALNREIEGAQRQIEHLRNDQTISSQLRQSLNQLSQTLNGQHTFLNAADKNLQERYYARQENLKLCTQQEAIAREQGASVSSLNMHDKFAIPRGPSWQVDAHVVVRSPGETLQVEAWQRAEMRLLQAFKDWLQKSHENQAKINFQFGADKTRVELVKIKVTRLLECSSGKEALQARNDFVTTPFGLPCFDSSTYEQLVYKVVDASVVNDGSCFVKFQNIFMPQQHSEISTLAQRFLKELKAWEKEGELNYRYGYEKEYTPDYTGKNFLDKAAQHKKDFISFAAACQRNQLPKAYDIVYKFYELTYKDTPETASASIYYETVQKDYRQAYVNEQYLNLGHGFVVHKEYAQDEIVKSLRVAFEMHDAKVNANTLRERFNTHKIYHSILQNLGISEPKFKVYGRQLTRQELLVEMMPCAGLNLILKERCEVKDAILQKCGILQPTEVDTNTAYGLIGKTPVEQVAFLADTLSSDHTDSAVCRAYTHFYDQYNLPKTVLYDAQMLKGVQLPKVLAQGLNSQQRKLLASFVLHKSSTWEEDIGRAAGIQCVARGCESNECAPLYLAYACSIDRALQGSDTTVLVCDSICKQKLNDHQLENQLLTISNQIVNALQVSHYLTPQEQQEYRTTLLAIDRNIDLLNSGIPTQARERLQSLLDQHQTRMVKKTTESLRELPPIEVYDYVVTGNRSVTELTADLRKIETKINDTTIPRAIRELYKEVYDSRLKLKGEQAQLIQEYVLSMGEVAAALHHTNNQTTINELVQAAHTVLRGAAIVVEEAGQIRQDIHKFVYHQDIQTKLIQCAEFLTANLALLVKVGGLDDPTSLRTFGGCDYKFEKENIEQLSQAIDTTIKHVQNMSGEERFRMVARIGLETALYQGLKKTFALSKANHRLMMHEIEKQLFTIKLEPSADLQKLGGLVAKEIQFIETLEEAFIPERRAPPVELSSGLELESSSRAGQFIAQNMFALSEVELAQVVKNTPALALTLQNVGSDALCKAFEVCDINPMARLELGALHDLKTMAMKISVLESNPQWAKLAIDKTLGQMTRYSVNNGYAQVQQLAKAVTISGQAAQNSTVSQQSSPSSFVSYQGKVNLKEIVAQALNSRKDEFRIIANNKQIDIKVPKGVSTKAQEAIRNLNINDYNLSTAEKQILIKGIQYFQNTPGALNKEGPLAKILLDGASVEPGDISKVQGALYEIETGIKMIENGEEVIAFGANIILIGKTGREFDIITSNRLIECKNINWISHRVDKQSIYSDQNEIAKTMSNQFEVHSKRLISENWKSWFKEAGIKIIED